MTAQGTRDATTPVIGEVPPDAHYLAAAQRAWLALVADIPVGVLALATRHVTDSGLAHSALLRMLYVDQRHRGSGIATTLLETARAAMTPLQVQHDGMTSVAGLSFVEKHRIPQCPCTNLRHQTIQRSGCLYEGQAGAGTGRGRLGERQPTAPKRR